MDADKFKYDINEWLTLSNQGLFVEARKFYFDNLFEGIIENFVSKTAPENHCDVLFSILGFSPEPIILTQRALMPSVHVIITTNKEKDSDNEIMAYLEKFLTSSYKIIHLKDETLHSIHNALKGQMLIYPASRYVIDITGGKKSMVASASIFGRNYNCDVVYVDYDEYIPDLRRPMPGTEKLNTVYSVQRDFVELLNVDDLKSIVSVKQNTIVDKETKKKEKTPSTLRKLEIDPVYYNKLFKEHFECYVGPHMYNPNVWCPKNVKIGAETGGKSFTMYFNDGTPSRKVARAEAWNLYQKCLENPSMASQLFGSTTSSEKKHSLVMKCLFDRIRTDIEGKKF